MNTINRSGGKVRLVQCSSSRRSPSDMSAPDQRRRGDLSPPVKLEIVDVEKRSGVSKYYAYIIEVTCKDGTRYTIYRRYRQFDDIHNALEKRFPIEAGAISSKDRTLPNLPGKIFFGRSAVRDVTEKRAPQLNHYLKKLFSLPEKICQDSIMLAFVKPTGEDQRPTTHGNQAHSRHTNGVIKPERPPTRPVKPDIPLPAKPRHNDKPPRPSFPVPKPNHLRPSAPTRQAPPLSRPAPPPKPVMNRGPTARTRHVAGNYIEIIQPPVTHDPKDSMQSSDEWESSDEEDGAARKITYYFNGAARTMEVEASVIQHPSLAALQSAIQRHLHRSGLVLNYKDSSGDLVEMVDESDVILLQREGIPPRKTSDAPWAIYMTTAGDNSVYHLDPGK